MPETPERVSKIRKLLPKMKKLSDTMLLELCSDWDFGVIETALNPPVNNEAEVDDDEVVIGNVSL
jgi:hypothetical protein